MNDSSVPKSAKVKLQKKVDEILHFRLRPTKAFFETLNNLNVDIITESRQLKNDDESHYRSIIENLDKFSNNWETFKNKVKKNLEIYETISQKIPSDEFSYLKDLQSNKIQLEGELDILQMFHDNFQLVDDDYRLIFEKSAPLQEYLRIIRKIDSIEGSLCNLSQNSYTNFGEKVQNQMKVLKEKCLHKISTVLKSQFETHDIFKLLNDPAFCESIELIKPNSFLIKNSLLGYISFRKSLLSKKYHRKFTMDQQYRRNLLKIPLDIVVNIENFIIFAFDSTISEFNELEKLVTTISLDCDDFMVEACSSIMECLAPVIKQHFDKLFGLGISLTSIWVLVILFGHYIPRIRKYLNKNSLLYTTLVEIRSTAIQLFRSYVSIYCKKLVSGAEDVDASIRPSSNFSGAVSLIESIFSISVEQFDHEDEIKNLKNMLISNVMDSLEQSCFLSASSLEGPSIAVFLINSLLVLKRLAKDYSYDNYEKIESKISGQIDTLVSDQCHYIFTHFSVSEIYQVARAISNNKGTDLSKLASLKSNEISIILSNFASYIGKGDPIVLPQLILLSDIDIRTEIEERSKKIVESAYNEIRDIIQSSPKI